MGISGTKILLEKEPEELTEIIGYNINLTRVLPLQFPSYIHTLTYLSDLVVGLVCIKDRGSYVDGSRATYVGQVSVKMSNKNGYTTS